MEIIQEVEEFTYLGALVTDINYIRKYLNRKQNREICYLPVKNTNTF
jgi:hypothetical protein